MARASIGVVSAERLRKWTGKSARRPHTPQLKAHAGSPLLLWIDDFAPALIVYKATMEALGFRVLTASSGQAGLKLAAFHHVDLVVTDYEMPGMNGEMVATAVKSLKPGLPVIIFSGSTAVSHRVRRYADAFCDKAGSRNRLLGAIHRLLHRKHGVMQQTPPLLRASDQGRRAVA